MFYSRFHEPYQVLFIDWDDTIGDFKYAEIEALKDLYAKYELKRLYASFEEYFGVYHEHNLLLWEQYGTSKVTKDFLQHDRFLYPLLPLSGVDQHALADDMGEDFLSLTSKYFRLLPDADRVVRYLSSRYRLTVVTNGFGEVQYDKIRQSGLADCFDYVVLSEEIGYQKPNPKFFEAALRISHISYQETLMIGDSWTSDINGARKSMIDQMWITDEKPNKRHPSTYRVGRLRDLLYCL